MSTTITSMQQNAVTASTTKDSTAASEVKEQKPTAASLRSSFNAQIIEASLKVSIQVGDNPQGLLFRTSLESIYESIGGFKSNINPDYKMPSMNDSNNPYATPEGTANVILSFSLGLYAQYSQSHQGEDEAEMATNFIELIRGGFEKGYGEAVDILESLSVFNGDIKTDIEKTWELVQKGYDDWLSAKVNPTPSETETASTGKVES
ncbi:MAG: DUF5610 domain-containing protein [Alistipes senegalensis]|nr:DUF5610 domain-containing protein [Oxalobacter formigenes]MCM1281016.1 DUF5610 domain-containing protein [Alistipes senegalensis]